MKNLKTAIFTFVAVMVAFITPNIVLAEEGKTEINEIKIDNVNLDIRAGSTSGIFTGKITSDNADKLKLLETWTQMAGERELGMISNDATYNQELGEDLIKEIKANAKYDYYSFIDLKDQNNYEFADEVTLYANGGKLIAKAFDPETGYGESTEDFLAYINTNIDTGEKQIILCSKKNPITAKAASDHEFKEGENQTYDANSSEALTFRIDADHSLFENGGKVYIDGSLVDSSNYTSKSGSTIIEFTKSFAKNLLNGAHNLKVEFNDGTIATTAFTIKNGRVGKVTGANEETTTNNPATSDGIVGYGIIGLISVIALTSAIVVRRKKLI